MTMAYCLKRASWHLLLLVLALAVALLTSPISTNAEDHNSQELVYDDEEGFFSPAEGASHHSEDYRDYDLGHAESQQIAMVASSDLQAQATGYGKGHGSSKGHKADFHKSKGHKGKKGHKKSKGKKGSKKGSFGKKGKKGFHDKGGKKHKGSDHKSKYFGKFKKGKKGGKGHSFGAKGHKAKGKKKKGFKNVYHKEEYGLNKKFHDDSDFKKHHSKYDDFDSFFKSKKGGSDKGGKFGGKKFHDAFGKKGFSDKGDFHDHHKGHKASHGDKKHFDKDSSFGKKGGHKSSKGHKKGHGGYH